MTFEDKIDLSKTILQKVTFPVETPGIKVFLKRIDLTHQYISGNKWFKLKYNLVCAREGGYETLLTFGGAYSNHIHAAAAAGNEFGFNTIGVIRGEEHLPLNPTLSDAVKFGMKIHYVDRTTYRKKHLPAFHDELKEKFGRIYIVPEGGTNTLAVKGCSEIPSLIECDYDYICTACGTAGTISGVIAGLDGKKKVLGFAVLKGASFLNDNVRNLLAEYSGKHYGNWSINLDYHIGGYAKIDKKLVQFIKKFEEINGIPLDPVYTGKMMFGIYSLLLGNYFPQNTTIVALHTGGLQGINGMKEKMNSFL
jgi:1-aminocyclopropane-1-carboxylate deaminase